MAICGKNSDRSQEARQLDLFLKNPSSTMSSFSSRRLSQSKSNENYLNSLRRMQNAGQLFDSITIFLTFLLLVLPILSGPLAVEALPLRSHKHHAVLAESDVRHEHLTPVRPPALSHGAAGGPPAKHLKEGENIRRVTRTSLSHRFLSIGPHIDEPASISCNCLQCSK